MPNGTGTKYIRIYLVQYSTVTHRSGPLALSSNRLAPPAVVRKQCFMAMSSSAMVVERAQATERALADLRAELSALEDNDPIPSAEAHLTASIEDLAGLYEDHASTMRDFGRVLRTQDTYPAPAPREYGGASMAPPMPSNEPDFLMAGRRVGGGSSLGASADVADALPPRPDFARPLLSSSADTSLAPPERAPPAIGTMPMQRSADQRRQAASVATARQEAAVESRYAAEVAARRDVAAAALERREAARQAGAQRSQYVVSRSAEGLGAGRTVMSARGVAGAGGSGGGASTSTSGAASARLPREQQRLAVSAEAPLPVRIPRARATSAPRERRTITVPTPFSFEHRPKRDQAAIRRMQAELEEQRREAQEAKKENKARPVPA